MGEFHIVGGNKIEGELNITGGKNAILPILASVVLSGKESIIKNCPNISDTYVASEILKSIGCSVNFQNNVLVVNSKDANNYNVPENLVSEMRSSIIFMGGVIGRFKKCKISYPGGCELGARPIDIHLKGLKALGVEIKEEMGFILCQTNELIGNRINLDFPSVGATENIMLAAVLAKGETIITNCAREPEIVDLQNFLNSMGGKITGAGTDRISITGVTSLNNTEYTVMPDRIVAGTYLIAAGITNGEITLNNVNINHMIPITSVIKETGCIITEYSNDNIITIKGTDKIKPIEKIRTLPHPGFPTDMQPQLMTLLGLAQGTSVLVETVFESRNKHISELIKMGGDILLSPDGMTFIIKGVEKYHGAVVSSKDLRGGAALILAGLSAKGKTVVRNSKHIERGYASICEDLKTLGANIEFYS